MFSSIMPKDYIKILNNNNNNKRQKLPYGKRFLSGMVFIAVTVSLSRRLFLPGRKQTNYATDKPRERLEEC